MVLRSNVPFRESSQRTGVPAANGSASDLWGVICPVDGSTGDGDIPDTPFKPFARARTVGIRPSSVPPSALPWFHCPFPCGLFRGAAFGQLPKSPAAGAGAPFVCPFVVVAVAVDEAEDVDDIEDDEFVRDTVFRGMKTPRTSSGFIEFNDCWPPLIPHACRLMFEKDGGFATAVMREEWPRRLE